MRKHLIICFYVLLLTTTSYSQQKTSFYGANHPNIKFTGRVDFSDIEKPKFYAPGVYVEFVFEGTFCEVEINDEELYGTNHNYITVCIDNNEPKKIQLAAKNNKIVIANNIKKGKHKVLICKATESGIGYLEFVGVKTLKLLPVKNTSNRKIEFIGNSITCGMGSDLSIPCDTKNWYDQHNSYVSYGALTARSLNAKWQLTAVSGIGLMHSCCNLKYVMPQVYDKINLRENENKWNFKNYQPDIITICLGQNDGIQDSVAFISNYIKFINVVRENNPSADIVCLTSPMADKALTKVLQNYLTVVVDLINRSGDKKISKYFFSKSFNSGCTSHPNLTEHVLIAKELTSYLRSLKSW